jgi:hypothetical protein
MNFVRCSDNFFLLMVRLLILVKGLLKTFLLLLHNRTRPYCAFQWGICTIRHSLTSKIVHGNICGGKPFPVRYKWNPTSGHARYMRM